MNTPTFRTSLLLAALLTVLGSAQAATISHADYKAGKDRVSADYKNDRAACDSMAKNAKDVCIEEAKAKKENGYADLEYQRTNKQSDWTKVLVTRAKGTYAVSKERCDDKAGNDKDVCVKEAKAVETSALADAKLGKKVAEARQDAQSDKMDADYKVEAEKCDAMAGDAKSSCIAAAKAKYGKS